MFLSYEYIKYLGYDKAKNEYSYQSKITDSDFEEVVVEVAVEGVVGVGVEVEFGVEFGVVVGVAVIDTYEKRNLNVAKNLMLAILYHNKKYPYVSVADIVRYYKQCNPKFAKYEEELNKYLSLL